MPDFKPSLQIVQITDFHCVEKGVVGQFSKLADNIRRRLQARSKFMHDLFVDGFAPHDQFAIDAAEDFVESVTVEDDEWNGIPTWLFATGDHTTWGDDDSMVVAREYISRLEKFCTAGTLEIYGNHDAWPDTFPPLAPAVSKKSIRTRMANRNFPVNSLHGPLLHSVGPLHVQAYGLDSVSHGTIANTLAYGHIQKQQRRALISAVDSQSTASPTLRILASHHPICHPSPPALGMVLVGASRVAHDLMQASPGGLAPIIHLVLSGHTHEAFPEPSQLPNSPRLCAHDPMGSDQWQLISGSSMQHDVLGTRGQMSSGQWPQQIQVLRVYSCDDQPDNVKVERQIAGRRAVGDFEPVPLSNGSPYGEMLLKV